MPILNYTTSVDTTKTVNEIMKVLSRNGANKIIFDNDKEGNIVAISFHIPHSFGSEETFIPFTLPCNFEAILKIMSNDKKVPKRLCTKEQAMRVGWRILKVWIDSQMALVETKMVSIAEVFLPYAIMKNGNTVYNNLINQRTLFLIEN